MKTTTYAAASLFALAIALFGSEIAAANPTPSGTEGKDFAQKRIYVEPGHSVRVTVTNTTIATSNGNRAGVILWDNDLKLIDQDVDAATKTASITISGPGYHDLMAIGFNTHADAYSVAMNVSTQDVQHY